MTVKIDSNIEWNLFYDLREQAMTSYCPDCGAPINEEDSCTNRFYRFLAPELADAEYGVVHHLTVAAYMLQHPNRLSKRGWQAMRELLAQALDPGLTPEALRAKMRSEVDSGRRSWSLVKGPRPQPPAGSTWSLTILSVDETNPAQYRAGIEQWARQALIDAAVIRVDAQ